ncbi:putative reverse transcriptase domain-containing protein [Tanacetum coccineum]
MPLSTYLNLGLGEFAHTRLTVELADRTVKYPKGIAENVLVGIGKFTFPIDFIILDMPEDVKVPLILGRPFLSTAHAKIDVYKRKITLRLDLEARLIGETLVLNRSLDPFSKDYIELNDLNEPFELRRNQGDDLMPTIEEGEVIEEFRTRDEDLDTGIDDYPSYCDDDKKIHIDFLEDMDAYRDNEMCAIIFGDLDNSTSYVLIPLDSWTSGLLVYKLPLSVEYGVSTSIGYGVSSSLSNTSYSLKLINTAYPLLLDTAYGLSRTEDEILNMYHGTYYEDMVDHIAKVLKMVDSIYVPGVDSHQLQMKVFPLSLADDAKEWWIEADVPLLRELGAVADEPMVFPLGDEISEPIVEAEEQVIAPVVDLDEDIAMLFGDDDFGHDDLEGFDEEEVWEVIEEWLIAPVTPPPMPVVPPPSVYKLVKKVIQVSDAEVAAGITIKEIGPRISAIEGQVQVMASQMVYAADRFEQIRTQVEQGQQTMTQRDEVITGFTQQVQALQADVQQRDSQIQQLQTTVSEKSSRESTLMQCILGMYS